ncbi:MULTISPECIES: tetraacyldisaccharide 4'-kinase [unclassified Leeuwenhoekiella]|uniref:tetraacyldisaccharide 4'-kinase n=1 Tax=unclassified Leeuwenhoekiella TaxID=2615029 RepID=UPI000C3D3A66|nr:MULTISPECIES: tetraacyldisaccharide 4'-kinase [unclassified Leeuwenhoekiella]MAW96615.1 tetraacyldisaccharide 4'-kinase [Leeuwenhoekiella sp.]MBA81503.1 tetraacyldisaccharide 4'-kinase [Leeuwenhoekiella sp.]
MKKLRLILWPFAVVYDGITRVRNLCFEKGIFQEQTYDFPVIGVGNLSVGGTGKTPVIEYLVRLLQDHYKIATLSRGYGRKTKGYLDVAPENSAAEVGDEPLQFARKFNRIQVAVCEKRRLGIERLRQKKRAPEVVLLDDVYQHRYVKPGFLIMLTAYTDLFYTDFVLPAGNLRESNSGAARADLVVVTKCPLDLPESDRIKIKERISRYSEAPVYFSSIAYGLPTDATGEVEWQLLKDQKINVVTGIAKPKPFLDYLDQMGLNYEHLEFDDHHTFSSTELELLDGKNKILTTEKDYVRLQGKLKQTQLFYLPIAVQFLSGAADFDKKILKFTEDYSRT